jgi:hypothetical protein
MKTGQNVLMDDEWHALLSYGVWFATLGWVLRLHAGRRAAAFMLAKLWREVKPRHLIRRKSCGCYGSLS